MSKDKKIYLIGNSHIDPVWQWVWQEGFAEIKATWRSALDRMNEFPDYKFSAACSSYYMWIEKSDPEMFEEVKMRVKEGRWCIVGGQFVQPDCNIPSGESFARHSLVSQRYFKEKFGIYVKTGYNVDSFGHNGNMPLILKNSKIDNYIFMRPDKNEKVLPQAYFKWQSKDGSEVNTFRIFGYNLSISDVEHFKEYDKTDDPTEVMALYGVGNHGGGLTIDLLNWMKENLGENYIYSTPDEFFEKAMHNELPVINDDMQFHAKGCYSAVSQIKTDNRRSENKIIAAEKYSVLSNHLMNTEYPKNEINRAWENIMFNQFHDILGGCSVKEAYNDASFSHGETRAIAQRVSNFALQQISWNIDTTYASRPNNSGEIEGRNWKDWDNIGRTIVVFNPHDHSVNVCVPIREFAGLITDNKGNAIPLQRARDYRNDHGKEIMANGTHLTIFNAEIPAFGYKTFHCWADFQQSQPKFNFITSENSIENEVIRLTLDTQSGEIVSIYDKKKHIELLSDNTCTALLDESQWDTWAHSAKAFDKIVNVATVGKVTVAEKGPVRVTLRSEQTVGNSKITRDFSLLPNDNRIYVKAVIDFREEHKMLKFRIPVNTEKPKSVCEIPFGYIERPINGDENVCGSWISLFDGKCGIGVANDSKYSYDANENVLSLTVLRSPLYCEHTGGNIFDEDLDYFGEFTDQGIREFEYAIFPFESFADCKRKADELNLKPTYIQETFHKGKLSEEYSGLEISENNIIVTAIKNAEDDNGTIIRFEETSGVDTEFSVRLFENTFDLKIGHNAVKTVLINKDGGLRETDFIED